MFSASWVRPKKHRNFHQQPPPLNPRAQVMDNIDFVHDLTTKVSPPPPTAPTPPSTPSPTQQKILDDLAKLNVMMGKQQKEDELKKAREEARAEGIKQGEERAMHASGGGWNGGAFGGNGAMHGGNGGPTWFVPPPVYGPGRVDLAEYETFIPAGHQHLRRRSSTNSIGGRDAARRFGEHIDAVGGRVVRNIERVGDRVRGIENAFQKFQMEYRSDRSQERRQREMYRQVEYMVKEVLDRTP